MSRQVHHGPDEHSPVEHAYNEEDAALERLAASYKSQREDGDPNRTEYGFMVIVTCPNTMSRADVERDLKRSVGFGSPFVTLLYNVRAPRPVEVATPQGERL
jgi:hypothetical protein